MKVKDRAEAVGTYRHVNVFLMETLARWVPSTPEMEAKILFGRHLWLFAQLADRLGRRARELRAPLHYSRAPDPGFADALAALAAQQATGDRLEALYASALPAVERAYAEYLERSDALIDEPTVLIVRDAVRDLERMRAERARLGEEVPALRAGQAPQALASRFAVARMVAPAEEGAAA